MMLKHMIIDYNPFSWCELISRNEETGIIFNVSVEINVDAA